MARKLFYKVIDDGRNKIYNSDWDSVLRLQHWYNSEFIWTAGKLGFKMYVVFPNTEQPSMDFEDLQNIIHQRRQELRTLGLSDNETIKKLESEGLIIAQKGGYFENCIASGFTRVAGNEFNAYLICEFLLKVSLLLPEAIIAAYDEGSFVKSKEVKFKNGGLILNLHDKTRLSFYQEMINNRHVFSIVDPSKYDQHQSYQTMIPNFNRLEIEEKINITKDWNWLGFENNYDRNGDDVQGYDLNKKVSNYTLEF